MSPVSPARLAQSPPPGPGVWVTLGLGFVVLALFVATQLGCLIVLTTHTIGRVAGSEIEPEGLSEALAQTGLYLSFGGTTSALVATLAVVFYCRREKRHHHSARVSAQPRAASGDCQVGGVGSVIRGVAMVARLVGWATTGVCAGCGCLSNGARARMAVVHRGGDGCSAL